jgi:hypothetical protein
MHHSATSPCRSSEICTLRREMLVVLLRETGRRYRRTDPTPDIEALSARDGEPIRSRTEQRLRAFVLPESGASTCAQSSLPATDSHGPKSRTLDHAQQLESCHLPDQESAGPFCHRKRHETRFAMCQDLPRWCVDLSVADELGVEMASPEARRTKTGSQA